MSRPSKKVNISLMIPVSILKKLQKLKKRNKVSVSQIVRNAICEYV